MNYRRKYKNALIRQIFLNLMIRQKKIDSKLKNNDGMEYILRNALNNRRAAWGSKESLSEGSQSDISDDEWDQ